VDKTTLQEKAWHEFKEYLFVTAYLWIFFGMFVLYKATILGERVDILAHGVALINAVVLGKFMLIVKAFHPGRWAEREPLIYPILLKSAIFAIFLALCKLLEDVIVGYFHRKDFAQSITDLSGGHLSALLIFTVILFVVLIPLTAFGELERVVGEGKLHRLFLRSRDLSKPFDQQVV
jgi:hypothetical protein